MGFVWIHGLVTGWTLFTERNGLPTPSKWFFVGFFLVGGDPNYLLPSLKS